MSPRRYINRGRCCLALLLCLLAKSISAQSVRLAILPQAEALRNTADLMSVALSSKPQIILLERAEIDRVQREQRLSALGVPDGLKVGELLGADGVFMLSTGKENEKDFLYLRLIAVKPGVILRSLRYPWPLADSASWASMAAQQFAPLYPKLGVLAKDAIPVSVLNVRAATKSSEGERIEKELTLLLIDRLSREKEIFVLERQHMSSLEFEKDLKLSSDSPFWSGSWLLEGMLDKNGYRPQTVSLDFRLVPPGGKAAESLQLTGPRDNVPKVADDLARDVIRVLSRSPVVQNWDTAAEAERYLKEAQWASKWGVHEQAKWAADSAWALRPSCSIIS